jgi:hypothetical protein
MKTAYACQDQRLVLQCPRDLVIKVRLVRREILIKMKLVTRVSF